MLIPLLPVIARTIEGATNMPVPTILFRINALQPQTFWSASGLTNLDVQDALHTLWKNNQDDLSALQIAIFHDCQGGCYGPFLIALVYTFLTSMNSF